MSVSSTSAHCAPDSTLLLPATPPDVAGTNSYTNCLGSVTSGTRAGVLRLVFVPIMVACRPGVPAAPVVQFEDVLRPARDITLAENREVLNVKPRVTADPYGGFIVADPSESQIRLYSADGRLRQQFGRRGGGPGEFDRLAAAVRSITGEILAFEMGGRLTVFDSTGSNVLRREQTPIAPLYHVAIVDHDKVVITGRVQGRSTSDLVHIWDFRRGRLTRSFFRPTPPNRRFDEAYLFSGFSDIAVRKDTIAVLFALTDTLFLYGIDGRQRGTIPLPFAGYRRLQEPMPRDASPRKLKHWIESFSTASHLYWKPDGTFLVQFFDTRGSELQWRLLGMRRNGRPLFEIENSPKLLALTANADSLIFVKPGSEAPNVWTIAQVRK